MGLPQVATIVKPPRDVFKEDSVQAQEHEESSISGEMFDRIEYPPEGGQLVYYFDHPFPCKGNPYPSVVDAIKVPKKLFKAKLVSLKEHPILTGLGLLLPNFILKPFLKTFFKNYLDDFAYSTMSPFFLIDDKYTPMAREIRRAGHKVVDNLEPEWQRYGHMVVDLMGMVLEYDNAWRYRMQDISEEINKDAFAKSPYKELGRIAILQGGRERGGFFVQNPRFTAMAFALRYVFLFKPFIAKILKEFIAELDIEKVKLDEADEYYNLLRPDYDIHGIHFEIRQRKAIKIINEYRKNNPDRLAEAQKSDSIKTQILDGMKDMILEDKGFPLITFYATQEEVPGDTAHKKVTVKQMETLTLKNNPTLRKLCIESLSQEPNPDAQ